MKKVNETKKVEKQQKRAEKRKVKKTNIFTKKSLEVILYVTLIVLISLISFVGIYTKSKNKMVNKIPNYILGTDINGARNIVIKVDDTKNTKTYDANGNEVTNTTENTTTEGTTTKEVPVNDDSILTIDNYQKVRDIIISRLKYMQVEYYEIKYNEADGTIYLEVPENTDTDYIAQYCITKGAFSITDNETSEVLLSNTDIKEAKVQYSTSTSGTTVYLNIQFNKEASKKLEDISNTYVKTTDSDGNETEKKVKMALDDQTIMTSSFDEPITTGTLQLQLGTSTDSSTIQKYAKQASNVAVFLNSEAMPITYKMDINRFVYSDITANTLKVIVIVLVSIAVLMLVYMVIKYKKLGLLGAITNIGFLAILLLIIRYANVSITLAGIFAIVISFVIEYALYMLTFKTYTKKADNETKDKDMKKVFNISLEVLIPTTVIAVTFAVTKWEPIFSVGMILFWSVIEMLIYNFITIKFICRKEDK